MSDNNPLKIAVILSRFHFEFSVSSEGTGSVIHEALSNHDRVVLAVLGAERPQSLLDPLTWEMRESCLRDAFGNTGKVAVIPVPTPRHSMMLGSMLLREAVGNAIPRGGPASVTVIGNDEPFMTWLKESWPHWTFKRDRRFEADLSLSSPLSITQQFIEESRNVAEIRAKYGEGPHHTADAICTWQGKVLLVNRANPPFKGMLALPGGIVDPGEDPLQACLRELAEETALALGKHAPSPTEMARTYLRSGPHEFGPHDRDPRGLYLSHTFHFDFSDLTEAPRVVGGDDASTAAWHPLNDLRPWLLAFDHYDILARVLGLTYAADFAELKGDGYSSFEVDEPFRVRHFP